jgi:hypothetical protein
MSNRRPVWRRPAVLIPSGIVVVVVLVGVLAAFQPWKLIVDETVNEALPTVVTPAGDEAAVDPVEEAGLDESAAEESAQDEPTVTEQTPADPTPEAKPERVVSAEGAFISHEHGTTGQARIITLADGSRVLRLVDLDTSNGPDLKVWLAAAPVIEGEDGWFVFDDDEYLDLGPLKGNKGSQNYPIPDGVDISDLTSVSIWCDRFSVSFGAAELVAA